MGHLAVWGMPQVLLPSSPSNWTYSVCTERLLRAPFTHREHIRRFTYFTPSFPPSVSPKAIIVAYGTCDYSYDCAFGDYVPLWEYYFNYRHSLT